MAQKELPLPIDPKFAGCWFDNCRGIYIGQAVIETAQHYGWDWKKDGWKETDFTVESEYYHEACDSAERYLDELAPEGFWIGYSEHGGDFGMWESESED